jgi:hypothetical protein
MTGAKMKKMPIAFWGEGASITIPMPIGTRRSINKKYMTARTLLV